MRKRLLFWILKIIIVHQLALDEKSRDEQATFARILEKVEEKLQDEFYPSEQRLAERSSFSYYKQLNSMYESYQQATHFRTKMKRAVTFMNRVDELDQLGIFSNHEAFFSNFRNDLEKIVERRSFSISKKGSIFQINAQKDIDVLPEQWELISLYKQSFNRDNEG